MPGFRKDVLRCILELDIFCMSSWGEGMGTAVLEALVSSWGEGMGTAVLEALALRRPVVATTAGGLPEVVRHLHNGLLVAPRDPDALARAIATLLADPPLARRLAADGRKTVETKFTAEKMTADTLAIYNRLLTPLP